MTVGVTVGVGVMDGVCVCVGVYDPDGVFDGVCEGEGVPVGVPDGVGVEEAPQAGAYAYVLFGSVAMFDVAPMSAYSEPPSSQLSHHMLSSEMPDAFGGCIDS